MTLSVNQSLNSTANIGSIFTGGEPRRAPRSDNVPALPQGSGIKASQQAISFLDQQRRSQQSQPDFSSGSRRSQQAVDAYQSVQNDQRRAEVQAMLGVDLYA